MRNIHDVSKALMLLAFMMVAAPLAGLAQTGAPAQSDKPDSDKLALAAADAQKANMAALMKYSWKVKVDISKDGASKGVSTRTGGDYDLFTVSWQYRWGGGI